MAAVEPRRRIVGVSTKMYFSLSRTREFTNSLIAGLADAPRELVSSIDIFLLPDFIAVASTVEQLNQAPVPIWTGSQDCHWEDYGSFTGEVSPAVLRDAGVRIVEVGHAERRRLFGDTDAVVAKKATAVCRNGMIPLICIGEKLQLFQDEAGVKAAVKECQVQVEAVLEGIPVDAEVVLAYEPVWAIGAARPAGEAHVLGVVDGIRRLDCVQRRTAPTRVVYGGSARLGLFTRLKGGVDGVFLARFGHDPEQFVKIIEEVAAA
ncbi:triosephosphate isomerase [Paramyrothecium foliicola]|nr:triosephosphate isomerase [Paramyrothecium foliicola]